MKLKVLKNDYQGVFLLTVKKRSIDEALSWIFGTYRKTAAVYNRVGYYSNGNASWYEFKLPDNTFIGVLDGELKDTVKSFNNAMEFKESNEHPIRDCDWEMIRRLITNKVLKPTKEYDLEMFRREQHTLLREFRKKGVKSRKEFLLKVKRNKQKTV